jgi:hypothetical protein
MARFASGKKSFALCDRCGQRYPYKDIKPEIENRRPNGLRVCPQCFDRDHPQLQLGRVRVIDAQALRHPRPDRTEPTSNVVAFNQRFPHTAGVNNYTLNSIAMSSEITMTLVPVVTRSASMGMISPFTQTTAGTTDTITSYTVTVASGTNSYGTGNKYYIAGLSGASPTLTLSEGSTYRFDQSDASNSGHPLRFSATANGTHGSGSQYTTGVTSSGTPGSSGAYVQITVPSGAPTLYYYCTNHSGMGGQANTP